VKLVVGLGNPGAAYTQTRHNVGWMVLDRLADRAGWGGRGKQRDDAAIVRGRYGDLDLALVKPTTYMNLSGLAVRKVLAREHVPLADLLVVVDDFDLPLGKLRLRENGSAGTHNGLRSIVTEMETQKFSRLRVGIGEPSRTAIDHVLSRFTPGEQEIVDRVLEAAADAVEDWARNGTSRAANRWNAWTLEPPAAASPTVAGASGTDGQSPGSGATADDGRSTAREVGPDGIVRTRTGWRKLLPGGGVAGRNEPR
jgi:peptidyl-tRNA hydrolase, PTH1 family